MANVKDDDAETLDFADDPDVIDDIAEMIADTFGRSVIDADRQLAERIISRLGFTPEDVDDESDTNTSSAGAAWREGDDL